MVGSREVSMDADSLRGFHDKFKELAGEERTLLEKLEKREILSGSPEERILQVRPEDRWLRAHGDYSTDILGGVAEAIRRLPPNERRKAWERERGWSIQGRVMTAKLLGKYPGDKWVERLAQPAKPECGRWHLCGGSSEGIRAQFVALATQAGKALDPPQGTAPLDFWLHSLFLYLRKSSSHELQGADDTGGIIRHVCEPSATFFAHLEAEAITVKKSEESPAKKQAPPRPPRPKVVPTGDLDLLKRMKSLRQVQAAAELDYSTRQVRNLLRDGKLTRTAKGRVAVDDKFQKQIRLRHSAPPK